MRDINVETSKRKKHILLCDFSKHFPPHYKFFHHVFAVAELLLLPLCLCLGNKQHSTTRNVKIKKAKKKLYIKCWENEKKICILCL
jgi:hypothetical protein